MWFDMCSKRVASGEAKAARPSRRHARRPAAPGAAWLVAVLGLSTLAACDDFGDRDYGRSEGFRSGRRDGDGRGWRGHRRHRDRDRDRPDAAAPFDAGTDAGAQPDASLPGTGAPAGSSNLDAGAADAGAAGSASIDAGAVDSAILALSDGQIVAVVDALLLGEIDHARAAEPLLADAEVIAFAEQTVAEREAARATLASLAAAIDVGAEPSALADEVLADNASSLEQLSLGPDAGPIDADFLSSREAVHARALDRFALLAAAADDPALRAQLVVLAALEQSALDRTRDLSASR
jgi:hypothetical protein